MIELWVVIILTAFRNVSDSLESVVELKNNGNNSTKSIVIYQTVDALKRTQ